MTYSPEIEEAIDDLCSGPVSRHDAERFVELIRKESVPRAKVDAFHALRLEVLVQNKNTITSGSPGPLYNAGFAAGCKHAASRFEALLPPDMNKEQE